MALQPFQGTVTVIINGVERGKLKDLRVKKAVSIANGEAIITLENIGRDYDDIAVNQPVEIYASDPWTSNKLLFKGYVRCIKHRVEQGENLLEIRAVDDTNKLHYRFVNANEFYVWEIGDLVKEIVKDLGFDTSNVNSSFIATAAGPTTSYNSGTATMLSGGVTFTCTWSDLDSYIYVKLRGGSYEFRMGKSGNGAYFEFWKGSTRLSYFTLNDFIFSQPFEVRLVARGSEFRAYVKDAQLQSYAKVLDVVDEEFQSAGYVEIGSDAGNSTFSDIKIIDESNMVEHYVAKGKSYFDALADLAEEKAIYDVYHDFWVEDGKLYFKPRNWASTGITIAQRDALPDATNCNIVSSELERSLLPVRNRIIVNGATVEQYYPWDGDMFTERYAENWHVWSTFSKFRDLHYYQTKVENGGAKVGNSSIRIYVGCSTSNPPTIRAWMNFPQPVDATKFKSIKFWKRAGGYSTGDTQTLFLASDEVVYKTHGSNTATENITNGRYYAMPFFASADKITIVAFWFVYDSADDSAPSGGDLTIELREDNGGVPGAVIASKVWSYTSMYSAFYGWAWANLNATVTKGQKYWLVFKSTLTFANGTTSYYFSYDGSGSGILYSDDGVNWSNFAGGAYLLEIREPENYFYKSIGANESWNEKEFEVGPLAAWNVSGNPDWSNIRSIGIRWTNTCGTSYTDNVNIDGLCFVKPSSKITVIAEDATSQSLYGIRELVINDAQITSKQRAEDVAKAKLTLLKDPKRRGRVKVNGNVNLEPGKTVTVNIPLQGINNETLRIIEATHIFNPETKSYFCELLLDEEIPIFELIMKNQQRQIDEVRARVAALEAQQVQI